MRLINKNRQKICLVLAISFSLILLLTACSVHDSPESIVKEFCIALQSGDLERGLACLTPSRQAEYQALMALFGGMSGLDLDTIFGGLVGYASSNTFLNMDFKITGTKQIDNTHVRISVEIYDAGNKTASTTIKCVRIDRDWYIDI